MNELGTEYDAHKEHIKMLTVELKMEKAKLTSLVVLGEAIKAQCNAPKIPHNFYNNFIINSRYELSQTWVFRESR